jgi:hypothetical protein
MRTPNASLRVRDDERGQMIVLAAFLIVVVVGMTALAVDIGRMIAHRRDLQNAADAMALAGAQLLPDAEAAEDVAREWGQKNGIDADDVEDIRVVPASGGAAPRIEVRLREPHTFFFARVLGIFTGEVATQAVAIKATPGGQQGLMPFAVLQSEVERALREGGNVTLKYDARNPRTGNFGALAIDGRGARIYEDTIKYGAKGIVCVQGDTACKTTALECDPATGQCPLILDAPDTETGNMIGPTEDGIRYRLANTHTDCDQFAEVFSLGASGAYSINPECNPFLPGSKPSLRVMVVPIIQQFPNGRDAVPVLAFALAFLEQDGTTFSCQGNSCEVPARFIKADVNTRALVGLTYDPESPIHFVRLVE